MGAACGVRCATRGARRMRGEPRHRSIEVGASATSMSSPVGRPSACEIVHYYCRQQLHHFSQAAPNRAAPRRAEPRRTAPNLAARQ